MNGVNGFNDHFGNFTQVDDEFLTPIMAEIGDDFPYIDVLKYSEAELDELLDTDLENLLDKIESGFGESNLKETATAAEHQVQNDVITQQKLAGPVRQLETLQPQMQQEASQLRERLNRFQSNPNESTEIIGNVKRNGAAQAGACEF